MKTHGMQRVWLLATLMGYCVTATVAVAAAPVISATLEPQQIAMGDSAQLTITSSGTNMEGVNLPEVSGLDFRVVGQSHRIEMINGATLASTSVMVRVTPQAPGIYTIPGITPKSQPLVLRVNPDNGSGGNPAPGTPNAQGKLLGGSTSSEGIRMAADGAAFIRLILPKHEAFVGESIPIEIEVGARSGFARLNGLPTLTGGDVTLNNLSRQPETSEKVIDGKPYTLFTWHSVIAAVKPGKYSLSLDSPFTVRIRTRPQRDSMIDDMLGDPFLQNFFGATVQKDITVSSTPADLTVVELPTEGRPSDFSGAVGTFNIASDISATAAAAGDPLTLRMHVTGAGNFDRVDSPMLDHVDAWKTYPPKSSFKASDSIGYKGEKTFEQPIIAAKPGVQTLPALTFSYFDPAARRYQTAHGTPLKVTIAPSVADSSLSAPQAGSASSPALANAKTPTSQPSAGMRPDHVANDDGVGTLVPLYLRPRFLALSSLLALAFVGGWLVLRRGSRADGSIERGRRAAAKAANRVIKDMEAAARARNTAQFFNVARMAVVGKLAARWQVPPEDVTIDEVNARLGDEGAEIQKILALADEANYSGHQLTATDLEHWIQIVRERLEEEKQA
jgi:hypothetical protein